MKSKNVTIKFSADRHEVARRVARAFLRAFSPKEFARPAHQQVQITHRDGDGRMTEMHTRKVAASDGRAQYLKEVHPFWEQCAVAIAAHDPATGNYLRMVQRALGKGERAVARMKRLTNPNTTEQQFWDHIQGPKARRRVTKRVNTRMNKLRFEASARAFDAKHGNAAAP